MATEMYIAAKCPRQTYIDYVMLQLADGREVAVNWEDSYIGWDDEGFGASYKHIFFDESSADVHPEELKGAIVTGFGICAEGEEKQPKVTILCLAFFIDDNEEEKPAFREEVEFFYESCNKART